MVGERSDKRDFCASCGNMGNMVQIFYQDIKGAGLLNVVIHNSTNYL